MSALTAGPAPQQVGAKIIWPALAVALLAALYAGWCAWDLQGERTSPLDLDGWGHLVSRQKAEGASLPALFTRPSLWKGPVVPFLFGLAYYVAPFDESVLVFNAFAFALAAGGFVLAFYRLGAGRVGAVLAVLAWVFYLPLRHVFGYYFAEPVLALLLAATFLVVAEAVLRRSAALALAAGALCGALLLSRAPFFLAVCGVPVILACHVPNKRLRVASAFAAGCVVAFAPWGIRNWVEYHELIPFTTEGGKILFQGTYLAGDDVEQNSLRQMPEYVRIESEEGGKTEIEKYRYWRGLALEQARGDVGGELRLCARKAIRFWTYLPQNSWWPAWKTGLVALVCLPLAAFGALAHRRSLLVHLCLLWVGGLWAFHTLVHAELRYSFPVLPMAYLLAVLGAQRLVGLAWKRLAPAAGRSPTAGGAHADSPVTPGSLAAQG